MRGFARLHEAVQHHIVNSLGWRSLRPLQDEAVAPILDGHHVLLLAPTAGGKTEAAIFPLLSRILTEGWSGLCVLYLCPIKALLNDLQPRLARYARLVGRRVGVWHGDVGASVRRRLTSAPPDLLLTTPESLEAMLLFRSDDRGALFGSLRCVVIDELHAFAGDYRGWHLQAVLERVARIAGRPVQRLGLSATIGNPTELLAWLAAGSSGDRTVVAPARTQGEADIPTDVRLDFVGSTENAALVLSRLYRGEKRLVFCDSRARVEALAAELRRSGVRTFVSHSSLSLDERRRAEQAFQEASDCVIVATSTLELGVDVGDLDRVIQIEAPSTVASFVQRLGRTGRRPGTSRNCLFLATTEDSFLQAAGLSRLWAHGYVEPVVPPARPLHVLAQQILALVLQEGAIGRATWPEWLPVFLARAGVEPGERTRVLAHLVEARWLFEDQGLLTMGPEAEQTLGRRRFMDLCSVFTSPPLFRVLHGNRELGRVHESTFQVRKEGDPVLLLAGRSWVVRSLDWRRKVAQVEATDRPGRSRWLGGACPLSFRLCRAIREVLGTGEVGARLTARGERQIEALRAEFAWVDTASTQLVRTGADRGRWWTFAGLRANQTLRYHLGGLAQSAGKTGNLFVGLSGRASVERLRAALAGLPERLPVPGSDEALSGLKFSACLPPDLARAELTEQLSDPAAVAACATEPVRFVSLGGS